MTHTPTNPIIFIIIFKQAILNLFRFFLLFTVFRKHQVPPELPMPHFGFSKVINNLFIFIKHVIFIDSLYP